MGKTKKETRRGRRRPGVTAPAKQNLDAMLDSAQAELEQFHLEEARQLLNRALELRPDSVRALEMSAGLLLDIGEMEAARTCLQRACELQPDTGHTKYLSLAQLLQGAEAAHCYSHAVQLLTAADDEPAAEQQRQLSAALCALADLHMTDLCDEQNAEQRCREYVQRALAADPASAEAHLTHASLQLVLGKREAASAALQRSTDLWLPEYRAARQGTAAAADPLQLCPLSYDVRLATARALIECHEWDRAVEVLDGLSEEDDQVVDTWYLLGLVAVERGGDDDEGAHHRRAEARAHLQRARDAGEQEPEQRDAAIDEHVTQLLAELGPVEEDEHEEEKEHEGEDEWTDDDDDQQQNGMDVTNG